MKVSEGVKKSYDEKKDEIFRDIMAQAEKNPAQPGEVSTETENRIKEGKSMERARIKTRTAGFIAVAACAAVVIGAGIVGGVFDDEKIPTSPAQNGEESSESSSQLTSEWEGNVQRVLLDTESGGDISSLAEISANIVECNVTAYNYEICNAEGDVIAVYPYDEIITDDEILSNGYDVYTVYEAEVTFVHKGNYAEGDTIKFRQLGGIAGESKYVYESGQLDTDKSIPLSQLLVMMNDDESLTDTFNSVYSFDTQTGRYVSVYGNLGDEVLPWIYENFKGENSSVVRSWADGRVQLTEREEYSDEYGAGTVINIEEEIGETFMYVSKGSLEMQSKYKGMDYREAKALLEDEGYTVNVIKKVSGEADKDKVVELIDWGEEKVTNPQDGMVTTYKNVDIFAGDGGEEPETDEQIRNENEAYLKEYLGLEDTDSTEDPDVKLKIFGYRCGEIEEGFENLDIRVIGISSDESSGEYKVYCMVRTLDGSALDIVDPFIGSSLADAKHFRTMIPGELKVYGDHAVGSLIWQDKIDSEEWDSGVYSMFVIESIDGTGTDGGSTEIYTGKFTGNVLFE